MKRRNREKEVEYAKFQRMHLKNLYTPTETGARLNIAPAHMAENLARSLGLSKEDQFPQNFATETRNIRTL
jgi:hypothetical protein